MIQDKNLPNSSEEFEIEDSEVRSSINAGVMSDTLDMKRIVLWSVITSVVIIILIAIAFNIYQYFKFEQQFQQAINTEYRELNNHIDSNLQLLNTTDVIDEEAGIFRIPVDSAKTIIIQRYN
ncbi:MAG: hypothetical protein LAT67_04925 [Balneolales bacterium]|nr:hypothetical protein [Balneolales bacterium]